ncbi:MAG TPA: MBL fold metallo-hydrolase [Longimicrobium sp.]|nr:MBL fold metallo-hydrolase [Longimicrobium sp.]
MANRFFPNLKSPKSGRWRRVMRRVLLGLVLLLVAVVVATLVSTDWLASFGGRLEGARLERARRSPHFVDGKFRNAVPTQTMAPGSFWPMMRHQLFGDEERVPSKPPPVVPRTAADFATPPASGLRATWIGHASVLVELDGRRVLTDPIWSDRCSPSTWAGPKRFHPPPVALAELPPIDVVVISHDHYDHLDMATVKELGRRGTHFAVPLGIGAHLETWGIPLAQIHELDWNEGVELAGLTVTATPARHYSGRNPLHGDETLWASWALKGPSHRVFFSGDSGHFDGFRNVAAKHGPFDLTLIKVGASDPTWSEIHMLPEEAVQTHLDVGGRVLVPIHWGTFNLAFHAWNEPAERVVSAAKKAGVTLVVPRPGEPVEPSQPQALDTWWR